MTSDVPSPSAPPPPDAGTLTPPTSFRKRLRFLGPSLILTGSIVGSGELIITTTLGARMGFVALWLIILSCALKVIIQEEIGRYTISSGDTSLEGANRMPGPRWIVSWVVWAWMIMTALVCIQVGGIIRGIAQALDTLFPGVGVTGWGLLMAFLTVALLLSGRYGFLERTATLLVVCFTFTTIVSAVTIQWSPHAIQLDEVLEGLKFHLPAEGLAVAFAVFGITGIGTTEIFYYPNLCKEKGYARFAGPNRPDASWVKRSRGWISVMQTDAIVAMFIYTTATIAFYLLGAGVLHRMGLVPEGHEMLQTLSNMFTETFGPRALTVFLVGAFFVLYSTLFVAIASNTLMAVDCLGVFGHRQARDPVKRVFWIRFFVVVIASLYTGAFLLFERPVAMVMVGGIAQTVMLPVIALTVLYLRYRHLDRRLWPSRWIDVLLWTCSFLIVIISSYTLIRLLPNLVKQVFG